MAWDTGRDLGVWLVNHSMAFFCSHSFFPPIMHCRIWYSLCLRLFPAKKWGCHSFTAAGRVWTLPKCSRSLNSKCRRNGRTFLSFPWYYLGLNVPKGVPFWETSWSACHWPLQSWNIWTCSWMQPLVMFFITSRGGLKRRSTLDVFGFLSFWIKIKRGERGVLIGTWSKSSFR